MKNIEMANSISERYGATPYGFSFITRERKDEDLDSKIIKQSGIYYLGGKILTLKDIENRNNPNDRILISNMKSNKIKKVIENTDSYKITLPFYDEDTLLEYIPPKSKTKNA